MAVTNSKVLFCYVPHNKTMPATPDANTVYFLEDAQELWVGNKLIASNAMTEPPTFNIVGTGDFIANAAYDSTTNTLTLTKSTLPVYTITKQQTADTGYSATYQMFKDGVATGDKINIPLDMVIENAQYKVVETADVPYAGAEVGDPYIDFTIANSDQTHLYVPLKGLVDVYTGGTHITVTNNVINHDSQGSDTSTPLGPDVPTPGQGQTGAINVSGQVAYDSLGHVISVTAKNIYSAVKAVADASAAEVGNDKIDKIANPTGDMIARSTASGGVAESTVSVSDLTGAISDIADLESNKMDKIASATGNKVLMSNASGEAVEGLPIVSSTSSSAAPGVMTGYFSDGSSQGDVMVYDNGQIKTSSVNISDLATQTDITGLQEDIGNVETELNTLETLVGTIPAGSSATTVVDYAQEVATAAAGDAVGDLDLTQVGGAGYYVTTISQADGQVAAAATQADTVVTNASSNLVTSGAVYSAVVDATPTWTVVE